MRRYLETLKYGCSWASSSHIPSRVRNYVGNEKKQKPKPPEIGPYFLPVVLALMGSWCFYDGWLTTDPEMLEHATFNRIGSVILLAWALIDFIRTRASEKAKNRKTTDPAAAKCDDN